jgi:hypothetical protein
MKNKFFKPGFQLFFIVFLLCACAHNGPSNEIIKRDWDEFINSHLKEYCISFSGFDIIDHNVKGSSDDVLVKISGKWIDKSDSIETSGPCDMFKKSNGINQIVELTMVYEKTDQGWSFKGFRPN